MVVNATERAGAEIVKAEASKITEDTLATSVIQTDIYGMSFGTLTCFLRRIEPSNIIPRYEIA